MKGSTQLLLFLAIIAFFFYYAITSIQKNQPPPAVPQAGIHTGTSNLYPNSTLTPGDIIPTATRDQICQKGYTKKVRNVSLSTKKFIYIEYHLTYPQPKGNIEVDHFIPLELGGSNDIKNLWAEPANPSPSPGFHQKDVVENYLHAKVCSGQMNLIDAQQAIQNDWYAVFIQIPNQNDYQY